MLAQVWARLARESIGHGRVLRGGRSGRVPVGKAHTGAPVLRLSRLLRMPVQQARSTSATWRAGAHRTASQTLPTTLRRLSRDHRPAGRGRVEPHHVPADRRAVRDRCWSGGARPRREPRLRGIHPHAAGRRAAGARGLRGGRGRPRLPRGGPRRHDPLRHARRGAPAGWRGGCSPLRHGDLPAGGGDSSPLPGRGGRVVDYSSPTRAPPSTGSRSSGT
jgi:hypothetical protein